MAEFRNIHTRIWKDEWFCELPADARLLFIYLFSNERASVCGLYELPLKFVCFEVGIEKNRVLEILADFEKADKVYYRDGYVWVVNLQKYNDSGNSPKVQVRIGKDLAEIPDCELKKIYYQRNNIPYPYPIPQGINTVGDTVLQVDERDGDNTEIDTLTREIAHDPTPAIDELPPAPGVNGNGLIKNQRAYAALAEHERRRAQGMVDVSWLQECLRPLGEVLIQELGFGPPNKKHSEWQKSVLQYYEAGIKPKHVKKAGAKARTDGLTLKGPESLFNMARSIKVAEDNDPDKIVF